MAPIDRPICGPYDIRNPVRIVQSERPRKTCLLGVDLVLDGGRELGDVSEDGDPDTEEDARAGEEAEEFVRTRTNSDRTIRRLHAEHIRLLENHATAHPSCTGFEGFGVSVADLVLNLRCVRAEVYPRQPVIEVQPECPTTPPRRTCKQKCERNSSMRQLSEESIPPNPGAVMMVGPMKV